jgi:hypothetical protein
MLLVLSAVYAFLEIFAAGQTKPILRLSRLRPHPTDKCIRTMARPSLSNASDA